MSHLAYPTQPVQTKRDAPTRVGSNLGEIHSLPH